MQHKSSGRIYAILFSETSSIFCYVQWWNVQRRPSSFHIICQFKQDALRMTAYKIQTSVKASQVSDMKTPSDESPLKKYDTSWMISPHQFLKDNEIDPEEIMTGIEWQLRILTCIDVTIRPGKLWGCRSLRCSTATRTVAWSSLDSTIIVSCGCVAVLSQIPSSILLILERKLCPLLILRYVQYCLVTDVFCNL